MALGKRNERSQYPPGCPDESSGQPGVALRRSDDPKKELRTRCDPCEVFYGASASPLESLGLRGNGEMGDTSLLSWLKNARNVNELRDIYDTNVESTLEDIFQCGNDDEGDSDSWWVYRVHARKIALAVSEKLLHLFHRRLGSCPIAKRAELIEAIAPLFEQWLPNDVPDFDDFLSHCAATLERLFSNVEFTIKVGFSWVWAFVPFCFREGDPPPRRPPPLARDYSPPIGIRRLSLAIREGHQAILHVNLVSRVSPRTVVAHQESVDDVVRTCASIAASSENRSQRVIDVGSGEERESLASRLGPTGQGRPARVDFLSEDILNTEIASFDDVERFKYLLSLALSGASRNCVPTFEDELRETVWRLSALTRLGDDPILLIGYLAVFESLALRIIGSRPDRNGVSISCYLGEKLKLKAITRSRLDSLFRTRNGAVHSLTRPHPSDYVVGYRLAIAAAFLLTARCSNTQIPKAYKEHQSGTTATLPICLGMLVEQIMKDH
jgi:hypothetical protein